jgi:ABC-type uncharacterized transport system ATPase subunit
VAGIDPEIAPCSLAGLDGPNGGKTTSLAKTTGLLQPAAGQILINGLLRQAGRVRSNPHGYFVVFRFLQKRVHHRVSGWLWPWQQSST